MSFLGEHYCTSAPQGHSPVTFCPSPPPHHSPRTETAQMTLAALRRALELEHPFQPEVPTTGLRVAGRVFQGHLSARLQPGTGSALAGPQCFHTPRLGVASLAGHWVVVVGGSQSLHSWVPPLPTLPKALCLGPQARPATHQWMGQRLCSGPIGAENQSKPVQVWARYVDGRNPAAGVQGLRVSLAVTGLAVQAHPNSGHSGLAHTALPRSRCPGWTVRGRAEGSPKLLTKAGGREGVIGQCTELGCSWR